MHKKESREISNRKDLSKTILACREANKQETTTTITGCIFIARIGAPYLSKISIPSLEGFGYI